jgi:biopolymer transport protein ExbD/biopolymer transport protein TolR
MGIAVRNEGQNVNSNINVTPMVDVMLVLLMAKVDNPTNMPDADKEDAIVVAITRDGGVFLGQNKIALSELGGQVRDKLADKPGKTIYVRADARAQFRAVEDAIDAVRTAGVDDVGLLTQKRELAGG